MSPCTAPILVLNRFVVRSKGLPKRSRVSGVAPLKTRPSRSCCSAKHPDRSASTSASPTDHWSFSAPYSHTQLRYLPSPLTTSLIINCVSEQPNCTGTFQCRSMNEHATPRSLSSEEPGRGARSSGCLVVVVVVVSLFALLTVSRSLRRCEEAPGRRLFFVFRSRVTSPRASRSPARSVRWAVLLCRPAIAGISLR